MFTNLLLASTLGGQLDSAFYGLDYGIFQFFGGIQSDFLTTLAKIFTSMGSVPYVVMIGVLALVLCLFKKTRKAGFILLLAILIGTIITNLIVKPVALRIRPYNTLQHDLNYWSWYIGAGSLCESDYSFPSGHTTAAFEIATIGFLYFFRDKKKWYAWLFPVFAILTGMSRIYLMVHYATDVFAGVIIGIFAGIMGYLLGGAITRAIQRRKIDDIVDLERLFKKGIGPVAGSIIIVVAWAIIFVVSAVISFREGGPDTIRCAYDREYKCMNEAVIGKKKYPPINGKNYCKIHWKQLNEQFAETGSVEEPTKAVEPFSSTSEPVLNTDFFSFYNDPAVTAFQESFAEDPPVKMLYSKGGANTMVTDPELIQKVFDALGGVKVGGEVTQPRDADPKESVYYTFYRSDGSELTFGIVYPYVIFYNDGFYEIVETNNAFEIIPDNYWEGIEQETETEAATEEAA